MLRVLSLSRSKGKCNQSGIVTSDCVPLIALYCLLLQSPAKNCYNNVSFPAEVLQILSIAVMLHLIRLFEFLIFLGLPNVCY